MGLTRVDTQTKPLYLDNDSFDVSIGKVAIVVKTKDNSGGSPSPIVIVHTTYSNLQTLKSDGTLVPGTVYAIDDRGISVAALDESTVSLTGFLHQYVPVYTNYPIWIGDVANYTQPTQNIGDRVIYNGLVWENTTGTQTSTNPSGDFTNWNQVPTSDTDAYIVEVFAITYDFDNDWITRLEDKRDNTIECSYVYGTNTLGGVHPMLSFQFGNDHTYGNFISQSLLININSFKGTKSANIIKNSHATVTYDGILDYCDISEHTTVTINDHVNITNSIVRQDSTLSILGGNATALDMLIERSSNIQTIGPLISTRLRTRNVVNISINNTGDIPVTLTDSDLDTNVSIAISTTAGAVSATKLRVNRSSSVNISVSSTGEANITNTSVEKNSILNITSNTTVQSVNTCLVSDGSSLTVGPFAVPVLLVRLYNRSMNIDNSTNYYGTSGNADDYYSSIPVRVDAGDSLQYDSSTGIITLSTHLGSYAGLIQFTNPILDIDGYFLISELTNLNPKSRVEIRPSPGQIFKILNNSTGGQYALYTGTGSDEILNGNQGDYAILRYDNIDNGVRAEILKQYGNAGTTTFPTLDTTDPSIYDTPTQTLTIPPAYQGNDIIYLSPDVTISNVLGLRDEHTVEFRRLGSDLGMPRTTFRARTLVENERPSETYHGVVSEKNDQMVAIPGATYPDPTGTFTKIHDFLAAPDVNEIMNTPLLASNNKLYASSTEGGTNGIGGLVQIDPSTDTTTKVKDFVASNVLHGEDILIGEPLIEISSFIYGVGSGIDGTGSVVKAPLSGFTTDMVFSFAADGSQGITPLGVILGQDGNLYGVTTSGGTNNLGTIFKYIIGGTLTVLYNFTSGDVTSQISANLMQASDGNLYGGTDKLYYKYNLITSGYSTLGTFTSLGLLNSYGLFIEPTTGTLYVPGEDSSGPAIIKYTLGGGFNIFGQIPNSVGQFAIGRLISYSGYLFGTTRGSFANRCIIYSIKLTDGSYTLSHAMSSTDGLQIFGGLTLYGTALYGVSSAGGTTYISSPSNLGKGTAFKFVLDGTSSGSTTPGHDYILRGEFIDYIKVRKPKGYGGAYITDFKNYV